jgi:hypothetical protein
MLLYQVSSWLLLNGEVVEVAAILQVVVEAVAEEVSPEAGERLRKLPLVVSLEIVS